MVRGLPNAERAQGCHMVVKAVSINSSRAPTTGGGKFQDSVSRQILNDGMYVAGERKVRPV